MAVGQEQQETVCVLHLGTKTPHTHLSSKFHTHQQQQQSRNLFFSGFYTHGSTDLIWLESIKSQIQQWRKRCTDIGVRSASSSLFLSFTYHHGRGRMNGTTNKIQILRHPDPQILTDATEKTKPANSGGGRTTVQLLVLTSNTHTACRPPPPSPSSAPVTTTFSPPAAAAAAAADMAASGGLEQWQKDGFFQAAEEVQESADLMESVYRTWMRERCNGSSSEEVDDLQRELQTALGTAKWQLEQFERAVSSSNDKYSLEEGTVARRRQFVVAIEDQISRVEKDINGSLMDNGRQGLNWVKLDDEERDDLVAFLSAPADFYSEMKSTDSSNHVPSRQKNVPVGMNDQSDPALIIKDIYEVPRREISTVKSDVCGLTEELHGLRRNLSVGNDHWKIDICNEMVDDRKSSPPNATGVQATSQTTALSSIRRSTESLTRERWFWNSLWKPKSDENRSLRYDMSNNLDLRVLSLLTQRFNGLAERSRNYLTSWKENSRISGRTGGLHIQGQQQNIQFGCSIRITLLLVLSIFLIVPFLVSA